MRAYLAGSMVLLLSGCGGSAYSEPGDRDDGRETETQSNQPAAPVASPADAPVDETPVDDDTPTPEPEQAPAPFAGNGGLQDQGGAVACTNIGCLSGFLLELEKQSAWQPGSYRFVARGDNGLERRCDLFLTPVDMLLVEGCNDFFMTRRADSPVPASAQIQLVADEVEIEVFLDGERIALARYEPTWVEHRPNGPRCAPVCQTGELQVLEVE